MSKSTPSPETLDLIKRSGSNDRAIAFAAMAELAKAFETPLRQGVLVGDILRSSNIFEPMVLQPGANAEFPLDLLNPGEEDDYVAFTNPGAGYIPQRQVEGDYVQVPTYRIANAIDWLLRYARDARWDIVQRSMQVMEAGFIKKINDDGWHTLITAGADRNVLVYDGDATQGLFTKRLVSLMKLNMRRNAGGNTGSLRRGKLTDLYTSPEAVEDVRNWGVDQIDEITRHELFVSGDGDSIMKIFGVNLNDLDEFGEDQEYQLFYTAILGGSMAASDSELVVGVDKSKNDSFLMPVKEELQTFSDEALHRIQKGGVYGWMELGFLVADNRRVLLGSF
jgi:hypothetical protein